MKEIPAPHIPLFFKGGIHPAADETTLGSQRVCEKRSERPEGKEPGAQPPECT
jgi:hypothetical protein